MKVWQILALILALSVFANAQNTTLHGTVRDVSGAIIPKINIIVIGTNGEKFETVSNNEGDYSLDLVDDKSFPNVKTAKYEIIVDSEIRGFEKFAIKDFKFVFSSDGKMNFDIVLSAANLEPCGYSGAHCLDLTNAMPIQTQIMKISDKVLSKPLEELPKNPNKNKRKINKQ